ncbi:MAG TPA: glycosyl transferase family 2, partial [Gammaproteobacteria bacterium]
AEFCWRAARYGATVVYCAEARVKHPARRSTAELVRKVRRLKGGQLRNGPLSRRIHYGMRGFVPPLRAWWRIWRSPRLGFVQRIAVSVIQARLWLAEMAETFRLLAGRQAERR